MKKARIEKLVVGQLQTNCYLFSSLDNPETAIIDPGGDPDLITDRIDELSLEPVCIINTHGHPDHTEANADLKRRFSIPILIHQKDSEFLCQTGLMSGMIGLDFGDSPPADRLLEDGDAIRVGDMSLKVIETPGHTPGSICLFCEDEGGRQPLLFTGDTVFQGSAGRTDLPGGSYDSLLDSIRGRIMSLPDNTRILPGHGPETTVGEEKRSNPFFV